MSFVNRCSAALAFLSLLLLFSPTIAGAQDADGDGVIDRNDNCSVVANPTQTDLTWNTQPGAMVLFDDALDLWTWYNSPGLTGATVHDGDTALRITGNQYIQKTTPYMGTSGPQRYLRFWIYLTSETADLALQMNCGDGSGWGHKWGFSGDGAWSGEAWSFNGIDYNLPVGQWVPVMLDIQGALSCDNGSAIYGIGWSVLTGDVAFVDSAAFYSSPPLGNACGMYVSTVALGGSGNDVVQGFAMDASGNVYLSGYFEGTVNFGTPYGASDSKTSLGGTDAFVTKINADGTYGWTRRIGGAGGDGSSSLAVRWNGVEHLIYVTGYYSGTVDFRGDFGGTDSRTAVGGNDIFITRITEDGSYLWTRVVGGTGLDNAIGLGLDSSGNVNVGGWFESSVNFAADFGGNDLKTSLGGWDIFLLRLNPDGTYGWTRRIGNTGSENPNAMTMDGNGNVFLTGSFPGTINFAADWSGTDNKTSLGMNDVFVTKIMANGNYGFTRRFGSGSEDNGFGLRIDSSGNIYLTGRVAGAVDFRADFGGGTDTRATFGSYDIFITRINADNTYGWTRTMGSSNYDQGVAINILGGVVYLTGYFQNSANFAADFGGADNKSSAGGMDIFLTRLSTGGTYAWTKRIGGTANDSPARVANSREGLIFVAGNFNGTVNFASDFSETDSRNSSGGYDVSITRLFPDQDGDGLADSVETNTGIYQNQYATGTSPNNWDTDGDTLSDYDEVFKYFTNPNLADTDSDGLNDNAEINAYFTDPFIPDTDADGLSDGDEVNSSLTDPLDSDTDGDTLTDGAEVNAYLTSPLLADTDGDGMPDGWEVTYNSCGVNPLAGDSLNDPDGDGIDNLREFQNNINPCSGDSDGDGLNDNDELNVYFTDPADSDSDDDNLDDGFEVNSSGTNPLDPDSDDDGAMDGPELFFHTNPLDSDSDDDGLSDGDEIFLSATNPNDADMDGDGLTDYQEIIESGTDPWLIDSDGDGLSDFSETRVTGTSPQDPDSDDDGIIDGRDVGNIITDRDNDGLPTYWEELYPCLSPDIPDESADPDSDSLDNLAEYEAGANPCAVDTDGDGLSDGVEVNATLTDPTLGDTDGDQLWDGEEINTYETDPLLPDTDGDGWSDGEENWAGSDPNDSDSFPQWDSHLINYQGRLMIDGQPANGVYAITFGIYPGETASVPVWSETQPNVTISGGLYNVLLGSVNPLTTTAFSSADAPGFFLQVSVGGQTLLPRTRLTSVPIAMFAERLFAGALATNTATFSANGKAKVTVRVAFEKAFGQPPSIFISPPAITVGTEKFIGETSDIDENGFTVTFESISGRPSWGTGKFTWLAFGN